MVVEQYAQVRYHKSELAGVIWSKPERYEDFRDKLGLSTQYHRLAYEVSWYKREQKSILGKRTAQGVRISPLAPKAALEDCLADKVLTPAELVNKCKDQLHHAMMLKGKADRQAEKEAKEDAKKPAAKEDEVEEELEEFINS